MDSLPTWQERAQWLDEMTNLLAEAGTDRRNAHQASTLFAHALEVEGRLRASAWPRTLEFRQLIGQARGAVIEAHVELIAQFGLEATDRALKALAAAESSAISAELAPFRSETEAHMNSIAILAELVERLGRCASWHGWEDLPALHAAIRQVPAPHSVTHCAPVGRTRVGRFKRVLRHGVPS